MLEVMSIGHTCDFCSLFFVDLKFSLSSHRVLLRGCEALEPFDGKTNDLIKVLLVATSPLSITCLAPLVEEVRKWYACKRAARQCAQTNHIVHEVSHCKRALSNYLSAHADC